jgi:hypothetical protein
VLSVQIQKLKLDVQVAMLELDQVLRSNEINFGVMAALPALLLAAALLYALRQATRPKVSPPPPADTPIIYLVLVLHNIRSALRRWDTAAISLSTRRFGDSQLDLAIVP